MPNDHPCVGVGLDGCRAGWVAARWDGHAVAFAWFVTIESWANTRGWRSRRDRRAAATLIDVPIGLLEGDGVVGTQRGCDVEARRRLGRRSSSVFTPPCREALSAAGYAEACIINRRVVGRAISLQAWHIVPKVAEVDAWLLGDARRRPGVLAESHPELAFATLSGEPLGTKKRSAAGRAERAALLREAMGVDVAAALGQWRSRTGVRRRAVADDDALDAAVLAWAAAASADELVSIPSKAEHDRRGLPMQLVCRRVKP
jgi:predicted RNase H-like nuclease